MAQIKLNTIQIVYTPHYKKLLIQIVHMAHICKNDMIQIKDMFQIVTTWLQFSTEEYASNKSILQQNSILRWTAWDRRSYICKPIKEPVIIHEMDASNDDSSNSDVLMCDEFRRGKIVDATPYYTASTLHNSRCECLMWCFFVSLGEMCSFQNASSHELRHKSTNHTTWLQGRPEICEKIFYDDA